MFPLSLFVIVVGLGWFLGMKGVLFVLVFVFQAQIADIRTTRGLHEYSAVSVDC